MSKFDGLDDFYFTLDLWSKMQKENTKQIADVLQTSIKNLYASDVGKSIIAFRKAFNDPESVYNQAMRNWSFKMQQCDLSVINNILEKVSKELKSIHDIEFEGLKQFQNLDFGMLYGNVVFDKSFTEVVDLAYEVAKKEAGEPYIDKEKLEEQVREKIVKYGIDGLDVNVPNNEFNLNP